jgi:hypothetical protein
MIVDVETESTQLFRKERLPGTKLRYTGLVKLLSFSLFIS